MKSYIIIPIFAIIFGLVAGVLYQRLHSQRQEVEGVSKVSRTVVSLLAILVGQFGVHRFYLG